MYPVINQKARTILSAVVILFTVSCTKTEVSPVTAGNSTENNAIAANVFASDANFTTEITDNGTTLVKYRPGPDNGNDVYSDLYWGVGSGNQNYVPELPINAWDWGGLIITRSFLQFPKLNKFSETLTIVSAKLYLYPPKDFLNHPQGNTGANACVIQRITSDKWKEDCLTWNTQPTVVTTEDQAFIPATTQQFDYSPVIDITSAISKMIKKEVPNYGFRITLVSEQPFAAVNFASSEAVDAWRRPTLVVEYK